MKKILLLMLVFVGLLTTSVQAQSKYYYDFLNPNNVGSWIGGMHFINTTTGWASSEAGSIHKTVDGGTTWTTVNYGGKANLHDIFFINSTTGWACGPGGVIVKSTDGGATWSVLNTGTTSEVSDLFFVDAMNGWAALGNGFAGGNQVSQILRTTDGGSSWTAVSVPSAGADINAIDFVSATVGYAASTTRRVFKTVDGGLTWTLIAVPTSVLPTGSHSFYAIDAIDANTVVVGGSNSSMYRTTNGGTTWVQATGVASSQTRDICFWDTNNGIAVGNAGRIMTSSNGGATWTTLISPLVAVPTYSSYALYACSAPSASAIYCGGQRGIVAKSTTGGGSGSWSIGSYVDNPGGGGNCIGFWDENIGMAGGAQGTASLLYKTTNAGATWTPVAGIGGTSIEAIEYMNANTVLVSNFNFNTSGIFKSVDNGTSWIPATITGDVATTTLSNGVTDIVKVNDNMVVACGRQGRFYKSLDAGSTWVASAPMAIAPTLAATGTNPATCTGYGLITLAGMEQLTSYNVSYTDGNGVTVGPLALTSAADGRIILSNMPAGRYTNIRVSRNGCTSAGVSVVLTPTTAPTFSASGTAPTTCGGSDGRITLTGSGAAGIVANTTYTLSYIVNGALVGPMAVTTNATRQIIINGLSAGAYAGITVVDAAGCVRINTSAVSLQDPGSTFYSSAGIPPTTCGGTDGGLSLTGLTASTPYTVSFIHNGVVTGPTAYTSDAAGAINILGLELGLYTDVKVATLAGCVRVVEMISIGDQPATDFQALDFVNENVGTIVGTRGTILRTIDGGATWTRQVSSFQTTGGSTFIWSVDMVDENNAHFCGITGKVYNTTNGGATWVQAPINSTPSNSNLQKIHFYDLQNGILYGNQGVIMKTSDGGNTWTQEYGISGEFYFDAYFVNKRTAYIAGAVIPSGGFTIIKQIQSCFPVEVVLTKPSGVVNEAGIFCEGESVTMTASQEIGASYLWSTGATTTSITVDQPGLYTLVVTYPEGCSQTINIPVSVTQTPPPVCNNNVQISLDEDCSVLVTDDMVLEGDTYCDYKVEITGLTGVPSYGDIVTGANIGQTLKVKVTHYLSGNSCWGQLTVEDKLPPVIDCANFEVACAETNYTPEYLTNTLGLPAYPAVVENCSAYTQTYTDVWTDLDCNVNTNVTAQITRTWFVTDASGNSASCTQTIDIIGARVDEILFPTDVTLDCASVTNTNPSTTGTPYFVFDYPNGPVVYHLGPGANNCELQTAFVDTELPVCDGTNKILRRWTVYDWCLPTSPFPPLTNPQYFIQVIKVVDENGPVMVCPANMTVSTDVYNCCATVDLPNIVITDNCSRINHIGAQVQTIDQYTDAVINTYDVDGTLTTFPGNNLWNPDTLANFGQTPCLPVTALGALSGHLVTYTATDDCGNHAVCSFRVFVQDFTPPVAVCDEFTVVAIGLDDPYDCYAPNNQPGDCNSGGIAWMRATTLDDGSYDNCGDVKFTVRRMDTTLSDCILGLNQTNGFDTNGNNVDGSAANCFDSSPDFPSEYELAVADADSIKFYCCEVGTTQTVILSVIQLNEDGSVFLTSNGQPLKNECMVQVEVQDKLKPKCVAPANVTVTCELFDPSLWAYGNAVPSDNCCLDTTKVFQGQCGLTNTVNYSQFDSLCNKGTITRNWTSYDCHGQTANCSQKVIVTPNQNYYVKFPADKAVSVCDGSTTFGEPTFFGEDCELLATSFVDEIFTVVPDACYKIERTWTVINWCTYTPNATCIFVPNPDMTNGPTVSAPGNNIATWAPTSTAVNGATLNYGTVWNANANCYKYKQIIKVIDTQDPTVITPAGAEYCDYSTNDANFWNAAYWWDGPIESHNMCEGDADITITATDACSGANISFRYLLLLDLDGNGSMETVVPGSPLPQVYNEVRFNNANTALYAGGEARAFDFRAVPANQKWGFGLQVDAAAGNNRTAHVRWVNQAGNNAVPQLPYGTHKIKWFVEDGCGNETVSETTLVVKDCKKPTVVCINGLSINQMNGPMNTVTLWASDFLVYGEDNCTPSPLLKYGIRKSGTGSGFPTVNGAAQTSVTFGCTELGTQLVELWAEDKAGNADFCETYVLVQDNTGACTSIPGGMASIAGELKTEAVQGVEDANVELEGSSNGVPITAIFTNVGGTYAFNNVLPIAANATVTPTLDVDPLNGVNTWDLVLISRHILGLEPLNSPYKLISADANKSGTVTTFDIVELRKLILGTYNTLPNNSSWRFVDKSQQFTDNANPFADVIRENLQIANIQSNISNGDFVAAKIGDVDGTATPNNLVSSDDRTAGTLLFDVTDRKVVAGEEFTVNFKAAEKVAGYQFTMNFNGLEVLDIVPGAGMTMDNFGIFADAVTTSVNGTEGIEQGRDFAVTFRAATAGQLSNMLGVSSRITKAVAFTSATLGNQLDVAFRYNNGGVSTIAGVGFELYQNAPNPFVNKTVIGFHLPEAAEATLSVYDETGRVLYTTTGNFVKGYNAVQLDRSLLSGVETGVLYYKLETVANSATKKMIQSK